MDLKETPLGQGYIVSIVGENGRDREIGRRYNDVFIGRRTESKHLFRGGCDSVAEAINTGVAAWGVEARAIVRLAEDGVRRVKIVSEKAVYECPIGVFLNEATRFKRHFSGFGTQYFVTLQHFNIEERK